MSSPPLSLPLWRPLPPRPPLPLLLRPPPRLRRHPDPAATSGSHGWIATAATDSLDTRQPVEVDAGDVDGGGGGGGGGVGGGGGGRGGGGAGAAGEAAAAESARSAAAARRSKARTQPSSPPLSRCLPATGSTASAMRCCVQRDARDRDRAQPPPRVPPPPPPPAAAAGRTEAAPRTSQHLTAPSRLAAE